MFKFLRIIAAFVIALFVLGYFFGDSKDAPSSLAGVASSANASASASIEHNTNHATQEVFITTAKQLYKAYDENEVVADESMKGKLIRVSGVVSSIDKDFTDSIVVKLKTGDEFSDAMMGMKDSEKSKVMKLRKDQQITVTCESMARIVGSPSGSDCVMN
ncbi:OB-fold protein [Serratia fonticola]|uniref:OB-fold protein n=1 Tax=Serratia fonticola TaxID=47917 RepID=UPI00301B7345